MTAPGTPRPKPQRTLGLDYGLARIGMALSDERKIIAMPHETLKTEKKLESTAAKLLVEINRIQSLHNCIVNELVIGLPLHMNGKMGMLADEVQHFSAVLRPLFAFPIVLWDERLTTVLAEKALREGNMSRKKRAKVVDKLTAAIILQNYLDHQHNAALRIPPVSK